MNLFFNFLLLLLVAITVRFVGNKLIPLAMPTGRIKTVLVGLLGGYAGHLIDSALWQAGFRVADIYLIGAFVGAALFVLLLGLYPFIKILLGKM